MRAVKQQKRLPREAVLPPSSEVCKAQLSVPVQPQNRPWLEKEVELEISCASFQSKLSCHTIKLTSVPKSFYTHSTDKTLGKQGLALRLNLSDKAVRYYSVSRTEKGWIYP